MKHTGKTRRSSSNFRLGLMCPRSEASFEPDWILLILQPYEEENRILGWVTVIKQSGARKVSAQDSRRHKARFKPFNRLLDEIITDVQVITGRSI
jgi:hypothetical protein